MDSINKVPAVDHDYAMSDQIHGQPEGVESPVPQMNMDEVTAISAMVSLSKHTVSLSTNEVDLSIPENTEWSTSTSTVKAQEDVPSRTDSMLDVRPVQGRKPIIPIVGAIVLNKTLSPPPYDEQPAVTETQTEHMKEESQAANESGDAGPQDITNDGQVDPITTPDTSKLGPADKSDEVDSAVPVTGSEVYNPSTNFSIEDGFVVSTIIPDSPAHDCVSSETKKTNNIGHDSISVESKLTVSKDLSSKFSIVEHLQEHLPEERAEMVTPKLDHDPVEDIGDKETDNCTEDSEDISPSKNIDGATSSIPEPTTESTASKEFPIAALQSKTPEMFEKNIERDSEVLKQDKDMNRNQQTDVDKVVLQNMEDIMKEIDDEKVVTEDLEDNIEGTDVDQKMPEKLDEEHNNSKDTENTAGKLEEDKTESCSNTGLSDGEPALASAPDQHNTNIDSDGLKVEEKMVEGNQEEKQEDVIAIAVSTQSKEVDAMEVSSKSKEVTTMEVSSKSKEVTAMEVSSQSKEDVVAIEVSSQSKEDVAIEVSSKSKEVVAMEVSSKSPLKDDSEEMEDTNKKLDDVITEQPQSSEAEAQTMDTDDSNIKADDCGDLGQIKITCVQSLAEEGDNNESMEVENSDSYEQDALNNTASNEGLNNKSMAFDGDKELSSETRINPNVADRLHARLSTKSLEKARNMLHSALDAAESDFLEKASPAKDMSSPSPKQSPLGKIFHLSDLSKQNRSKEKSPDKHRGDILDILRPSDKPGTMQSSEKPSSATTEIMKSPPDPPPKKPSNQIAKKSTTKKAVNLGSFKPKETSPPVPTSAQPMPVMVKAEPDDTYNYDTVNTQSHTNPPPAVVMENVHSGNTLQTTHGSLGLLTSQVNNMMGTPSSVPMPANQGIIMDIPHNVTKYSGPLYTRIETSGSTMMSRPIRNMNPQTSTVLATATRQPLFRPNMPNVLRGKLLNMTKPQGTESFPGSWSVTLPKGPSNRPVTIVKAIQPKPATVLVSSKKQPPIASGVAESTSLTNSTSVSCTIANAKKVAVPMSLSTINIDTVGLPKITELIARKNPIPNYKPPPVPDKLKDIIKEPSFVCYECGDAFNLEDSLVYHRKRYSMKISYKCDDCQATKTFFNKCQFLGHLRQHLNIDKTQAVPIHIKSDSIHIATLPKMYEHLILPITKPPDPPGERKSPSDVQVVVQGVDPSQELRKHLQTPVPISHSSLAASTNSDTTIMNSKKAFIRSCRECGTKVPVNSLVKHYQSDKVECDYLQHVCGICHMLLPSICASRSHKRLHKATAPYVCPECGMSFHEQQITSDSVRNVDPEQVFCEHIMYECFHVSRIIHIDCQKCDAVCESFSQVRNHLLEKLEQYYKCQTCPMAFKSSQGIYKHYVKNHCTDKNIPAAEDINAHPFSANCKYIYRCHLCDIVMDDLVVLDDHINGHLTEIRKKAIFSYKCLVCQKVFTTKAGLSIHYNENHEHPANLKSCPFCGKSFNDSAIDTVNHILVFHRSTKFSIYKPCKPCRRIIKEDDLATHPCNIKKTVEHFDCTICHSSYKSKKMFANHMVNHRDKGLYVCLYCYSTGFANRQLLDEHVVKCKKDKELGSTTPIYENHECSTCGLTFQSKQAFKKHTDTHKYEDKIACKLCKNTYFNTYAEYAIHRKSHHRSEKSEAKKFECPECKTTFATQEEMENHRKLEHAFSFSSLFPCHLCEHAYKTDQELKHHISVKHEAKRNSYECYICKSRNQKKSFSSKQILEKHLEKRHRKNHRNFQVEQDMDQDDEAESDPNEGEDTIAREKRKSEERDSADQPVKKMRVEGETSFNCAKCTFCCAEKTEFLEHLQVHRMANYQQCLECGLSFAVIPTLRKHLFMVHKVKDFEGYCQDNKINLVNDVDDNEEIKVVPPENMKFESDDEELAYQIDMSEASPEPEVTDPLECRVCHRKFDSAALVRNHMRTHGMAYLTNKRMSPASSTATNGWESSDSSSSSTRVS